MDMTSPRQRYAQTSFLLSVVSVPLLVTTIYPGMIVAGVAFILAVLTSDRENRLLPQAKLGFLISSFVIAFGVALTVLTFTRVILPALQSPEMMDQLDQYFLENTGYTLSEFLEQF